MKCLGHQFPRLTICPVRPIQGRFCASSPGNASLDEPDAAPRAAQARLRPQMAFPCGDGGVGSRERPKIRVFIACEVRLIRESLSFLLNQHADIEAIDSFEARVRSSEVATEIDVVVIDAQQDIEWMAARLQEFKASWRGVKIVVVGVPDAATDVLRYIEAGASGYVLKASSLAKLVETIRAAHRGEASSSPEVLALLFDRIASLKSQLRAVEDSDMGKLTQRELEVLQLVVEGLSNKEIAAALNLETQTVKNYVHNILDKLRVRNRREAVIFAQKSIALDWVS